MCERHEGEDRGCYIELANGGLVPVSEALKLCFFPSPVEEVLRDFKGRRATLIKALSNVLKISLRLFPVHIHSGADLRTRKREAHEAVYAMCCNVEQAWGRVRLVRMHGPKFSTITVTVS
ncbi:hypothetical protein GmHk_09G025689 [Glycine max]|nr:hypothetical protein GmHk_09G025689 [Glycine max]KAH1233188.1 hypothetical protein GmHk_09G025689 [Glycine max]